MKYLKLLILLLCLLPLAARADYESTIVADSPIHYWRLGEADDSSQAFDVMTDDFNADYLPYTGGDWTGGTAGVTGALTGDSDTAVSFNGSTGYMSNLPSVGTELGTGTTTIELWMRRDHAPSTYEYAVSFGTSLVIGYNNSGGSVLAVLAGGTARYFAPIDDAFHHVAVVYRTNGQVLLYIDGSQYGSTSSGSRADLTGIVPKLAAYASTIYNLNGTLDEVAIYDYELTSTQVSDHYDAGTSSGINYTSNFFFSTF